MQTLSTPVLTHRDQNCTSPSRDGGNTTYPDEGRKNRPIKVGQTYTLRFAVRDTLVNVWIDDEFMVAYRLPDRRPDGFLSLSGFDATVAFDEISIRSLAADVELTEAQNKVVPSPFPTSTPLSRQRKPNSSPQGLMWPLPKRCIAADNAKYRDSANDEMIEQLSKTAARLQAEEQIATAALSDRRLTPPITRNVPRRRTA